MYTLASHWYILLMIGISDFLERCLALPIRLVTSLPSLDSIVKQGFLQEYFLNDCKVKRVSWIKQWNQYYGQVVIIGQSLHKKSLRVYWLLSSQWYCEDNPSSNIKLCHSRHKKGTSSIAPVCTYLSSVMHHTRRIIWESPVWHAFLCSEVSCLLWVHIGPVYLQKNRTTLLQ